MRESVSDVGRKKISGKHTGKKYIKKIIIITNNNDVDLKMFHIFPCVVYTNLETHSFRESRKPRAGTTENHKRYLGHRTCDTHT